LKLWSVAFPSRTPPPPHVGTEEPVPVVPPTPSQ
jgi:hypothetical protein